MLSDQGCSWGGVRDASDSPGFRQTSVKPQEEELESKESDLVYVAHIEINNKCQMLWTCSNSHADEPTSQFWNASTQHPKNHKHLLFPFGFQGARCLLSNVRPSFPAKYAKETGYGYSTQAISPLPRGNGSALAGANSAVFLLYPRSFSWLISQESGLSPTEATSAAEASKG